MYTIDITRHLAELSKLNFTDEELLKMHRDMDNIITLMDKVREINREGIFELDARAFSSLRADASKEGLASSQLLSNAKYIENQTFTVPKII